MANLITLLRMPVLAITIALFYTTSAPARYVGAALIPVLIAMDSLDGIVARRRGESSVLGSVLDIAADRTVEMLLWVVFAHLRLIPIVIPLLVLARGVFVDALRAVAPSRGLTPFDLMRSPLGRFLVKSPWLRTPYALVKGLAFFTLALTHGMLLGDASALAVVAPIAGITSWLALGLCLARGIPVLIEGSRTLTESDGAGETEEVR